MIQMFSPKVLKLSNEIGILTPTILKRRNLATASSFQQWRTNSHHKMATPSKINLSVNDTGIVKYKSQDEETAKKTSELLQENHDVNSLTTISLATED